MCCCVLFAVYAVYAVPCRVAVPCMPCCSCTSHAMVGGHQSDTAHGAVDVYAFSMIAFELFEGWAPFLNVHPVDAARRAALHSARPQWGKVNRCGAQLVCRLTQGIGSLAQTWHGTDEGAQGEH